MCKLYDVILADPPWRYKPRTTPQNRNIENHYPTMTLEDMFARDHMEDWHTWGNEAPNSAQQRLIP